MTTFFTCIFTCCFFQLQKLALENELGMPDNPLKITWLEGTSTSADTNSESFPKASNSTTKNTVEAKVITTILNHKIIIFVIQDINSWKEKCLKKFLLLVWGSSQESIFSKWGNNCQWTMLGEWCHFLESLVG